MAVYMAALYAAIAHELENDYKQAKQQGAHQRGRDVGISKSDLVRPLLEESIMIACSYLHAAAAMSRVAGAVTSRRCDVVGRYSEYLDALRVILNFLVDDSDEISTDLFKVTQQQQQQQQQQSTAHRDEASCSATHYDQTSGTDVDVITNGPDINICIPIEFKCMVQRTAMLHKYLLPHKASLVMTTHTHLPPAFTLRLLVTTLLERVVTNALSARHRAHGHLLVVERAEDALGSVDRQLVQLMEFYSQNRLKHFYSDCHFLRDKSTQASNQKLSSRCDCREVLHIAVTA